MSQPTMEDVARVAGVSRALVSLVMRDSPKVSDERRAAVLEAAQALGYRPNVLARNLASHRTRTIGVTINDLHNPFFAEAVDGVLEAAGDADYQILLATGGRSSKAGESEAVETFLRFRVDGLILAGTRLPAAQITSTASVCPTVLLSRTVRSRSVDVVINDDSTGAALAVDHLVSLGHRRIAHIDGGDGAGGSARRAGYRTAMRSAGLDDHIEIVGGDYSEASGSVGARALLDRVDRPTAIFAANDLMAVGVRGAADEIGLSIPDDLSVVGYDNSALAATHHWSLTTIDQPRQEMGRTAFELLLHRLDNDHRPGVRHVVTPTLVVRESTCRPPRS